MTLSSTSINEHSCFHLKPQQKWFIVIFVIFFSSLTFAQDISTNTKSIKPLRIGAKIGVPNILTLNAEYVTCLLYTSPSPRDRQKSRMPSSA